MAVMAGQGGWWQVMDSNHRRRKPTVLQTSGDNALTCANVGLACSLRAHWA
jgi:hypothetical protein